MLTTNNDFLEEAAETAYRLSAEEKIRMQCEAREDYYRQQRYIQKKLERLKELESREKDMIESTAVLEEKSAILEEKNALLQENNAALQENNAALRENNAALQENNAALKEENDILLKRNEEKDVEIARLKLELANKR